MIILPIAHIKNNVKARIKSIIQILASSIKKPFKKVRTIANLTFAR